MINVNDIEAIEAEIDARVKRLAADEPIMKYFGFTHLRDPNLRAVSKPFALVALDVMENLPRSAERAAGLRKLLEAKDCFVRAALP